MGRNTANLKVIPPPTDREIRVHKPVTLVLELLWLLLKILPCVLLAIVRAILPRPQKSLKGQLALITGAGHGLGRGLALRIAQEGCTVAVVDINKVTAEATAADILREGGKAKAYNCNVAKVEEVKRLQARVAAELGPVDLLVNNAGLLYIESLTGGSDASIQAVIDVNLTSHFWMVRAFLPEMRERNSGHIVAMSSLAGLAGGSYGSAYVASKFGVDGFMECVNAEVNDVHDNKIKTTTVYPYFVNTSAHYVDHWHNRYPPISLEEAVEAILTGIKAEQIRVALPRPAYRVMTLLKSMPQYIRDQGREIFSIKVTPLSKEELETSPTNATIQACQSESQPRVDQR